MPLRDLPGAIAGFLFGKKEKPKDLGKLGPYMDKELVVDVYNFYQTVKLEGVLVGRIARGVVRVGTPILIMPICKKAVVKYIEIKGVRQGAAVEGESIGIGVDGVGTEDIDPSTVVINAVAQQQ
ncbi:MAG: hypothetical protein KAW41_05870 [Candidatus Diapherotrites archaeon]|nr:hypothetical protein [Candidatus Diapherotrites archaeon]